MDAAAQLGIDGLQGRRVGEEIQVALNDVLVVAHGRSRLGFARRQVGELGRCFLDEGKENGVIQVDFAQDFVGHRVAMVRKVAGEDGGEVKHLARFAVQFIHTVGNRMSKGCQLRKCLRVVRLDEERDFAIV